MTKRPVPHIRDKIRFLISSPHAMSVGGHNGKPSNFAKKAKIQWSAFRYLIGDKKTSEIDSEHENAIANLCQFSIELEAWRTGAIETFRSAYEALHPLGNGRLDDSLNAQLASIQLFANQSGDGWALGAILNCQETPLDFVVVGVKRGRVAIKAIAGELVEPLQNVTIERDGAKVSWQLVGKPTAPMWIVDAGEVPIGYLTEPEHLCRIVGLPPGEPVQLTFSAYMKDLHRIEAPADADEESGGLQDKSYSFARLGVTKLGVAKKAILTLLAARSMDATGFVELCKDTRIIVQASDKSKG